MTAPLGHPWRCLGWGLIALLVVSCAGQPARPDARQQALQRLQTLQAAGDLQGVAREYNKLAALAAPAERPSYKLKAAAALVKGNYIRQAQRLLNGVPDTGLTVGQYLQRQLLLARIAMAQQQPDQALQILSIHLPADAPTEVQAQFHALRADAYTLLALPLDAVRELITRETFLTDAGAITRNQQVIWRTVVQLPDETLTAERPADSAALRGWLALAYIAKQAQRQPVDVDKLIADWRARFPNHPAGSQIVDPLLARQASRAAPPARVALLLPLSGVYAGAAAALRDGFLVAYYAAGGDTRPDIRVYDTGGDAAQITAVYDRAVQDGAQFVVGPLNKDAVQTLMTDGHITVPTLTLNYPKQDDLTAPPNLYEFSLSPEDEARQVAERAWLDGHNEGIAIVPEGDWGDRVFGAFKQQWDALGGSVLERQTYNPEASDFSSALRSLLNLDESTARDKTLEQIIGRSVEFKPRRRQDADLVFMAAFPRQGRLIRPQLEFQYAGDLPVYATSHVYTGLPDHAADQDLDGVTFCDMPWVLSAGGPRESLNNTIRRLWPDEEKQYVRFYAMGIDAYQVIPSLGDLKRYPYEEYPGATGFLTMDADGRIHRRLQWARFDDGIPKLIDVIMPVPSQ